MTMSVDMRAIYKLAGDYDSTLRADDPRFRKVVIVKEEHGMSTFIYEDAFVVRKDDWYCVFTEHHGYHVYHHEDYSVSAYSGREGVDSAPF
jgi:hypothetical protein